MIGFIPRGIKPIDIKLEPSMELKHKKVLIISDIEGSSLCLNYGATTFLGKEWPKACLGMSLDLDAVVKALFHSGVEAVYVKDFHRTGFNLFPDYIDDRATIIQGYFSAPVPGIGSVFDATALLMVGMHAPSGSGGFLPHTLTSRISKLEVNKQPMSEAQLFSASVARFGLVPSFFSGCLAACAQAADTIPGLRCFGTKKFNSIDDPDASMWRRQLGREAVLSLAENHKGVYAPKGPFDAAVTLRDGPGYAEGLARRWGFNYRESTLFIHADTMDELYLNLIRLCYLTPFLEKILPVGLPLFNLFGKAGLLKARKMLSPP